MAKDREAEEHLSAAAHRGLVREKLEVAGVVSPSRRRTPPVVLFENGGRRPNRTNAGMGRLQWKAPRRRPA